MTAPEPIAIPGARSVIHRDAPDWDGRKAAAIGGFSCDSAEAGAALLDQASRRLAAEGFAALLGPMDGDTWHAYRVVTETDGSKPFLLEPVSGPFDHAAFLATGFAPVSAYVSTRAPLDAAIGDGPPVTLPSVAVSAWDGANAEALVGQLFELSSQSFAGNRFFKPIERAAFFALYAPVLPIIDPRFVLFARDPAGRLVGFLLGLPDRTDGARPTTMILKTYASGVRGVGHLLADSLHRRAREAGFTQVIHALMHVDNPSFERSRRHGASVFRRYALMGKHLDARAAR